ncbi:hypothetical protein KP509_1Z153800 [Ceratopteris richardii]|nr:hypothetical protein KP509_1Z153800 [Ceratopteris richardii]
MLSSISTSLFSHVHHHHHTDFQLVPFSLLLALLSLIILVSYCLNLSLLPKLSTKRHAALPPGPGHSLGFPFLGNFFLLGHSPHVSLRLLAKKFGPIMYLRLGQIPCVVVSSADMVRACFKENDQAFAGRPHYAYGKHLMYNCKGIGFAQYGPRWIHMRKICTSQLFSAKSFESFSHARAQEISSMVRSIWVAYQKQEQVNVSQMVFAMAANNISNMVMGERIVEWSSTLTPKAQEFKQMIKDFFWLVGVFNLGDHIPFLRPFDLQGYEKKMKQLHKKLDAFWEEKIQEHCRSKCSKGGHFLDFLISFTASTTPEAERLSLDDIKGALMDLFAAGTDTTSVAVEWAMSEVLNNKDVLKKAQEEFEQVVGNTSMVQESHLHRLKYLQAIVKESLRLHPPSPLLGAREALESCQIGGHMIPKGTRLIVNEWCLGRDESVWERPTDFLPERFLQTQMDVRGQNFELIPFGGGRRICMGLPLALCNVQLSLANLLHCFDWQLPTHQALDMSDKFAGTTLPKAIPLLVIPTPRLPKEFYSREFTQGELI